MAGWGTVFGWLFDRLPTKREGLLNEKRKLEREYEKVRTMPMCGPTSKRMDVIAKRLREVNERLETIKS